MLIDSSPSPVWRLIPESKSFLAEKLERAKLHNQILNLYQQVIFRAIVHKALG